MSNEAAAKVATIDTSNLTEEVLLTVKGRSADAETRVSLNEYKGKWSIDVRRFWQPEDSEEMKGTKMGASVPLEQLDALISGLLDVQARLAGNAPAKTTRKGKQQAPAAA